MEGGNLLVSPDATHFDQHDVVSIATTSRMEPHGSPLMTANATSAASAQAARLAARVAASYPDLWPETIRGLLVHAAEWTPPMAATIGGAPNKTTRQQLLRRYGFGTPTDERVLRSASNAVTLIAQSYIQPFEQVDSGRTRLREMHLHDLPWPGDQLLELGEVPVRLRVTLSYFIEPNASSRGWRGRYVYPSHNLRFDIRRPGETTGEFQRRSNRGRGRGGRHSTGCRTAAETGLSGPRVGASVRCMRTCGKEQPPIWPTAVCSACTRSADGGRTTTVLTGTTCLSVTPFSSRSTPQKSRWTSTHPSPRRSESR